MISSSNIFQHRRPLLIRDAVSVHVTAPLIYYSTAIFHDMRIFRVPLCGFKDHISTVRRSLREQGPEAEII